MDAKEKVMLMLRGMDGEQAAAALSSSEALLKVQIKHARGKARRELEADLAVVESLMATT